MWSRTHGTSSQPCYSENSRLGLQAKLLDDRLREPFSHLLSFPRVSSEYLKTLNPFARKSGVKTPGTMYSLFSKAHQKTLTHIRCPAIGQSTTTSPPPLTLWFIIPLTAVMAMSFQKQLPGSATAAEEMFPAELCTARGLCKTLATNLNI